MKRPHVAWFMALGVLTLLAIVSAPAFPQGASKGATEPEKKDKKTEEKPVAPAEATPPKTDATVEKILQQQEDLLRGQRFQYDPSGRRDPFRSLLENVRAPQGRGPRPKGAAGMLVTELDLVGIVRDPTDGDVALVMGSDNKGYFLRVGDGVYDGTVIAIDPRRGQVTFRQQVDDPRLIKPYRDVVKTLAAVEDEESAND